MVVAAMVMVLRLGGIRHRDKRHGDQCESGNQFQNRRHEIASEVVPNSSYNGEGACWFHCHQQ
jgi:hypothetical protein